MHQNERGDAPCAYFITFSTYGSRLRGDERGSIDRHQNGYGDPMLEPSLAREAYQRSLMTSQPFVLNDAQRVVATQAIAAICQLRDWELHSLNTRTQHVHAVVAAGAEQPERVMTTLKAFATKALRDTSLVEREQRLWSRHGSTRYLWNAEDARATVHYVIDEQGANLARALWVHPAFAAMEARNG